jgi:ADP-ribose pyrophosphatase YjhB (NUDIX family)
MNKRLALNSSHTVNWSGCLYKLRWVQPDDLPNNPLITTSHGYCFKDETIVVVENHRGCELPGGHIEEGESFVKAFKREVREEACVLIDSIKCLGFIEAVPLDSTAPSKYSNLSYMAFCSAIITAEMDFTSDFECLSRQYIEPEDIRTVHHTWHDIYEPSLLAALANIRSSL